MDSSTAAPTSTQLSPIGDPPFHDLQLEPLFHYPVFSGCAAVLSEQVPLQQLCDALAAQLGLPVDDVALLSGTRVMDLTETLRVAGVEAKLTVALMGQPAACQAATGALLEKWRLAPPAFVRRPPLAELPHFTTHAAESALARAGVCTTYGPRVSNEDSHIVHCDFAQLGGAPAAFFAVCDGHGGSSVSEQLVGLLANELRAATQGCDWAEPAERRAAVERGFLAADAKLVSSPSAQQCGSTCIAALLWRTAGGACRLTLANVGDSRGQLHRRGRDEVLRTLEQKPDDPREKRRIRAAGGYVLPADPPQPARLDGLLAMSRAMGDARFKSERGRAPEAQRAIALPEIYELEAEVGDVLVLACDGVFDVLPSEEVAALAVLEDGGPVEAAATVVWAALERDTQDNVTCLVVQLQGDGA